MTEPLPAPSSVAGVDADAVAGWMAEHRDTMVEDLVTLVGTETPSDDLGLLGAGLGVVEAWLTGQLGRPVRRTHLPGEAHGAAVVLDYPGAGPGTVVLLGHYDTVFDAGTLAGWPVRVDGDTVTGPGVFDMKAGLVQMVAAVRALDELGIARPTVRLVVTGDEEIGSPHSRPIIEEQVADARAVLVFEGSADGAVKTGRKGVGLFEVAVTGVESHAGLDPEAGASAVDEVARLVGTLHGAADLAAGTSINVGVVHGGTRANVVAGRATAKLDIRVADVAEQDRVDRLLTGLAPRDPRCTVELAGAWNRPVMEPSTAGVAAMYELARAAAARVGVDLRQASVGGASDANFVAALGVPVLDGMGAVGGGAHARHEHASIAGMVERATVASVVLAAFAG